MDKSAIYFGGVTTEVQQTILQILGFSQGSMPFRYLRVPLSTKKILIVQYQPLIDKIMGGYRVGPLGFYLMLARSN